MPRRLIKRLLPDKTALEKARVHSVFGDLLHSPLLWHVNRQTVSRAVAIGLFTAFMPIPFQMLAACGLAILFRANILIAVPLVWISNPITIPPLLYFAYIIGGVFLNQEAMLEIHSYHQILPMLNQLWLPILLGLFICATVFAVLGYCMTLLFWRYYVQIKWLKRRRGGQSDAGR